MPPAWVPEQFGRFRLLDRIGEGGMGVVYRAELVSGSAQQLVVKRVRPELARDPSFARMMQQEARLGSLLRHPCLVPVLETGEIDGQLYMLLEFVDGYDVSQILDRAIRVGRPVPIVVACYIALQAAEALHYAHSARDKDGGPLVVAHRDISPSNLMITNDGAVKLLDFGIAKASQDEHTRTGTVKGKLAYFSPEQADGLTLDARSDLFSLGIVLMELLLQRRLFRGNGDFDTLRRVREAEIPKPSTLREEIDPDLDSLLLRLLHRHREERFANAHELVEKLTLLIARYAAAEGGARDATRSFLRELAPIERRKAASTPHTSAPPPELDDATSHVVVQPLDEHDTQTSLKPRAGARRKTTKPRVETSLSKERTAVGGRIVGIDAPSGVPRWRQYLDSLPNGVKSFPQCTIKSAIVRNFNDFFGTPPLPDDLPREVIELVRNPPLVSTYVPGVLARIFLLAIPDVLRLDDDTFSERAYEGNKLLLASPLYRVLFAVMSVERLIRNVKSRWAAFHHGLELAVPDSGAGYAHAVLTWPSGFEAYLVLRMHQGGLRAAIEAVGAKNVRSDLRLASSSEAHIDFTWET